MKKTFTKDEIAAIMGAMNDKFFTNYRDKTAYMAMLLCGMRISEVCNLDVQYILADTMQIQIWDSKYSKSRVVPLSVPLLERFRKLDKWNESMRLEWSEENDRMFKTHKGKPIIARHLQTKLHRICANLGIDRKKAHPHTFRHTYATELAMMGMDPFALQVRLGHSDLKTVMEYVHAALKPSKIDEDLAGSFGI